jgi:hypothetical protein
VNPIILVWVGLSAFGLVLSTYLTRESFHDLRSLDPDANGRRTAAWSRFLREGLRITVHGVYLAIGIPLLGRDVQLTFVVLGLMWGNVVLVLNSLIDARARRLLFETRESEPSLPHD